MTEADLITWSQEIPNLQLLLPCQQPVSILSNTSYLNIEEVILHMLMLVVHRSELQDKVRHYNFVTWLTKMRTDNLRMFSKHIMRRE